MSAANTSGETRREAIGAGLRIGGVLAAGSIPLASAAVAIANPGSEADAPTLEKLIALAQTAAIVYSTIAADEDLLDAEIVKAAELFADQESEHVAALEAALEDRGGEAPPPPKADQVDGLGALESQDDALEFAVELENALIAAFNDAAEKLTDPALLKTAVQISCNDAQHLAVLRQQLGDPAIPEAFETGQPAEA
ncbi:MAG: ferritin-like domain-containing protein [Solirubrobacterales bacterium]